MMKTSFAIKNTVKKVFANIEVKNFFIRLTIMIVQLHLFQIIRDVISGK